MSPLTETTAPDATTGHVSLSILHHPHPALKSKCDPVGPDEDLSSVIAQMRALMTAEKGLGLAANQVGVLKRLFLFKVGFQVKVVINPEIVSTSPMLVVLTEGCLSFPAKSTRTRRPKEVAVRYENIEREVVEEVLSGIEAACFQHEYDHLKGKTMFDRQYMGRV